ncbi:MAG: alpha/beta hydrolase [Neobacillus sp.]
MKVEKIVLNEERNVTLTAYLQEVGGEFQYVTKRPAIMVLPGGGYQFCSDREADPVALAYLKAGYQVFILRYSVKANSIWPNPLNDYEQAMELIRSKKEEWCLYEDKIAVVGFSAGGHLASCAATMSNNRPNAAILGYAVTIGEDVRSCNPSAPDTVSAIDYDTCPCFVFATRTDSVVPIVNSTKFINALAEQGIAFESHIYAYGPHGFSTGDTSVQSKEMIMCSRAPHWVEDSISWLKDVLGDFGPDGMTTPVCKGHINGDKEKYLSIDCTYALIMSNPTAMAIVGPVLAEMNKQTDVLVETREMENVKDGDGFPGDMMSVIMGRLTLREILSIGKAPEDVLEGLDVQLRQIPNTI